MKLRIIIFISALVLVLLSAYLWYHEATLPVNAKSPTTGMFLIRKGETSRTIATNLKDEGYIRDPLAFFILIKQTGVETKIQAGDFRLSTAMSASEVLEQLQHGTVDVWVTIPEGWRVEEIALELAQELAIPEQEFLDAAEEGYMFPDTYLFPKLASGSAVAAKMKNTFDEKITEGLADDIAQSPFSLHEIVTLASLVEREARFDEERPMIASVLMNRLEIGQALQIDATVQYVLGYQNDEKDWWESELLLEDLKTPSPYNTYENPGLPPGPIANPGYEAIYAVLHPAQSNYFYYLHDANGRIHLAETFEQHQQNISQYLR